MGCSEKNDAEPITQAGDARVEMPIDSTLGEGGEENNPIDDGGTLLDAVNPKQDVEADTQPDGSPENDVIDALPELEVEIGDTTEGPGDGDTALADTSESEEAEDTLSEPDALNEWVDGENPDEPANSTIAETCFPWVKDPNAVGPVYDESGAVIGSHCKGTNHQDIEGVELVVFLGDSVTVGTPNFENLLPTDNNHYWRNMLAEDTIGLFGLDKGEDFSWGLWKSYDPFEQKGALNETGDFRNCAHWGARTDDFLEGDKQLEMCFPDGGSDKRTLVMFTVGGNDFKEIVEKGSESSEEDAEAGYLAVWEEAESIISHLEGAVEWLTDPVRFPNGVSVIFANPYEFTDGTGNTSSCGSAEVLSGVEAWQDKEALQLVSTWISDQFMQIAVSSQTDMVFMLENFCGHGYVMTGPNPDPSAGSPCDAGPDAEVWFDETCVHPNEAGHKAIYDMFKAVLLE
jgi:lysophospholipase L1-like esterase